MSGITTGVGIFSGIDSGGLIQQLLALASRPKILAQQRIVQLQVQQGGYLDINSRLQALSTAASAFRTGNVFSTKTATSSKPDVLTVTATNKAAVGAHTFLVDRLVTTQQVLSKGFGDADSSGLGATGFTFEGAEGRLDRDDPLADLNGGQGVKRGKIVITDSAGSQATVDLSKVATVGEVLDAINGASVAVTASVRDGRFVITDSAGGTISVANGAGWTTADSLGIAGTSNDGTITGSRVRVMTAGTTLRTLNDGNGIFIGNQAGNAAFDFRISVAGTDVKVNLGDVWEFEGDDLKVTAPAVSTVGGALDRINSALAAAGFDDVTASVHADGSRLVINDVQGRQLEVLENSGTVGNTAANLGLATAGAVAGTVTGARVLADINSTLTKNLAGGSGKLGDGQLSFTLRDGTAFNLTLDLDSSVSDLMRQVEDAAGANVDGSKRLLVSLSGTGDGLVLTDNTGGGGNLVITGNDAGIDTDTAAALGISTGAAGVAAAAVASGNLQHRYVALSTAVSSLNDGKGIGTGVFTIYDSTGAKAEVDIGTDARSVGDVIAEINSKNLLVKARINDRGDGILLYEPDENGAGQKIKVEDKTGAVARALNIRGEAKGTGAENVIDGSYEVTVEFEATDTLRKVVEKINSSNARVSASLINDGSGSAPWHLSLAARSPGAGGRFIVNTGGFDLGPQTLEEGQDARVFLGSSDPAKAVLLSSSSNTLEGAVEGLTLSLVSPSADGVTVAVQRDTTTIEAGVQLFVDAFNTAVSRIDFQTRYVADTKERGPLLGDGTVANLRNELYNVVLGEGIGLTGAFTRLTQVGIKFGQGGRLEFDRDAFIRAMDEDPEAVEAIFAARQLAPNEKEEIAPGVFALPDPDGPERFTTLGVLGRLEQLAKKYIDKSGGVLTGRGTTIGEQIQAQNRRIAEFDKRLEIKRGILQRQFLAMEEAIGKLSSQQGSLSQIAALAQMRR